MSKPEEAQLNAKLNDDDGVVDNNTRPMSDFSEHAISIAYRKLSYWWSTGLMFFCLFCILWGIGKQWNNPPWSQTDSHPVLELLIFLVMAYWIALLEGCQISIVGLQAVDMEMVKHSHPRAYAASQIVHKGPNVERFLVGRQFMLLFIVFLCTKVAGAKTQDFYIGDWHWNSEASQFLWENSVMLMIVIVGPCQLVSQLVAMNRMAGFFNLRCVSATYTVVYPCLLIESIGLTHSTYLLKDTLRWAAGIPASEADPEKAMNKNFLYWARVILSVSAVTFSGVFIVKGLAYGQTGASHGAGWRKLPTWAAVVCTCLFLFIMAMAEGMQVAALALAKKRTSDFKQRAPLSYRNCQLFFAGRNMQAFLVGRQFFVAMMAVLLAKATGYAGDEGILVGGGGEDWGMGKDFNKGLLQTGFLGAIFVVNVAQLASQVTASIFPVAFLNNYFLNWLLKVMLFVEALGIVNACWPLSWLMQACCCPDPDPFDGDEDIKTPAQNIIDRKKSMGIPQQKGVSPFDLHQPESEYHMEYTYKVSYI